MTETGFAGRHSIGLPGVNLYVSKKNYVIVAAIMGALAIWVITSVILGRQGPKELFHMASPDGRQQLILTRLDVGEPVSVYFWELRDRRTGIPTDTARCNGPMGIEWQAPQVTWGSNEVEIAVNDVSNHHAMVASLSRRERELHQQKRS